MFDLNHPFFLPVWRRYATVALCVVWLLAELNREATAWVILAAAITGWAIKGLLISFDADAAAQSGKTSNDQSKPKDDA